MNEEKKTEVKEEVKAPTLEELQKQIADLTASAKAKDAEIEKLKAANTNASADASEWKKQYRATLDEAARKEAERAEAEQAMREELTALKAEKRISDYTKKLMEAGYDAQTAATMAAGLPEGISDDFFATQKTFLDNQKQLAKTEALNNQPSLSVGIPPSTTKSDPDADNYRRWVRGE